MRLLTRYVLLDLLKVFSLSLLCLTSFLMLALGGKQVVNEGLGLLTFLKILPFILPEALRYAMPGTMLLTATNVYGRMASSNEVVAVKSLGISPMALVKPLLIFAAFVSLVNVFVNDLAASWGRDGARRVIVQSVEQIVYGVLQSQGTFSNGGITINVQGVDGDRLLKPRLIINETDSRPSLDIQAEEARLRSNFEAGVLEVECLNVVGTAGANNQLIAPGKPLILPFPMNGFLKRGGGDVSPADQSLRDIPAEIERRKLGLADLREELAATAAYQLISGDFDDLSGPVWDHSRLRLFNSQKMIYRLETERPRRWADGFSCFCFALVGAPLAIRWRRGEFLEVFFLCFLPVLLIFYPLLLYGLYQAKNGFWDPSCVWSGNVLFVLLGVWLLRGVIRH